jgi:4-hydroxybenzoate polyprenyltransferase
MPLFFSLNFLNASLVTDTVFGFICFSLLSSVVYILNDIRDMEKDRLHSTKRLRPLASGQIPVPHAVAAMAILSAVLIAMLVMVRTQGNRLFNFEAVGLLLLYAALNVAYSWGFKNLPLADVTILASGYVIRVLFGAMIIGVNVSVWLYLVVTLGAYYMGLGKRRNEITGNETGTRTVMRFYSHNFLDKNMYVCQALCVVFYALWSIDSETVERLHTSAFVYTIPIILIIFLKYSLNIETDADGDPVSVLLGDKILIFLCGAYVICAFCIIYLNRATQ